MQATSRACHALRALSRASNKTRPSSFLHEGAASISTQARTQIAMTAKAAAEKHGIRDATIEMTEPKEMGMHHVCELMPVTISGLKSGITAKLNTIIKVPKRTDDATLQKMIEMFFAKEIYVYTTLLPTYEDLQMKAGIEGGLSYIRYYHHISEPNRALVLQDMQNEGYKIYGKSIFLDLEHAVLSVQEVAKFHAMSLALQKIQPDAFADIAKHCRPMEEHPIYPKIAKMIVDSVAVDVEKMSNDQHKNVVKSCFSAYTPEAVMKRKAKVMCHYDAWSHNVLFKYKGSSPVSACLLDYKVVQLGNPAVDLLCLVSTCTDPGVRRPNYELLLRTYHATLAETLAHFGIDASQAYPYAELKEDLKNIAPASLVNSLYYLQTWFGVGGMHDIAGYKDGRQDTAGAGDEVAWEYRQAAENLIADFIEYGYM